MSETAAAQLSGCSTFERVTESAVVCFEQRLAASEAHRYAKFVRKQRKRQFLLGRMLLRLAVSKMMNVPVHEISQ